MTGDMALFIGGLGLCCLLLAVIGAVGDAWDSRERRDARKRNHGSRRAR